MPEIRIPGRYMLEASKDKRRVLLYCHMSKDLPPEALAEAQKVVDRAAKYLEEISVKCLPIEPYVRRL